jgi:14-3-3 protein epsilon
MEPPKWFNAALAEEAVPKRTLEHFSLPETHEELLFVVKLTEQTERWDEMAAAIRKIVKINSELTQEERNLLSVAYKNVIGSRRASWRIIAGIEGRDNEKGQAENLPIIAMLRKQCEAEIAGICDELINMLESYLIPASPGGEVKIFYLKMKGDYHRYWAEVAAGDTHKRAATEAYEKGNQLATSSLAPVNATRLSLALNLSIFYYEILKQLEQAYTLARTAYDDAVIEVESLADDHDHHEAAMILQLLQDNLNMWAEAQQ